MKAFKMKAHTLRSITTTTFAGTKNLVNWNLPLPQDDINASAYIGIVTPSRTEPVLDRSSYCTNFHVINASRGKLEPGKKREKLYVGRSVDWFSAVGCDVSVNGRLLVLNSRHCFCLLQPDGNFKLLNYHEEECWHKKDDCTCEKEVRFLNIVPVKPPANTCPSRKEIFSSVAFSHCSGFILFLTSNSGVHVLDVSGKYHGCLGKESGVPLGEGKILRLPGDKQFLIYYPGTAYVSIVEINCEEKSFTVLKTKVFGERHISCVVSMGDSILAFCSTENIMLLSQKDSEEIVEIPTELNPGVISACVLQNRDIAISYPAPERRITIITFEQGE